MWTGRQTPRIDLLVLQASSFCNIDCAYCYVARRDRRRRMDDATLARVAERVVPSSLAADALSVVWHAGEPLALPVDWMDRACARLSAAARPGQRLSFVVQTNATLIDDDWIALFRRHGVRVGVSVDGPRDLHDQNRRTRTGGGTFDRAMAGIERLRAAGIAFDAIAVLTRPALERPDALFAFFAALGPATLGFNLEEIEGTNRSSSLADAEARAAYRAFLARFLSRHAEAGEPFRLRALEQMRQALDGRCAAPGNDPGRPLSILTVGVDGGMSTFSPELLGTRDPAFDDFVFATLEEGGPADIRKSAAFARARDAIAAGRRACRRGCGYFEVCGGGWPSNKYFEHGRFDVAETMTCRLAVQDTVEVVLAHLEAARGAGRAVA